MSTSQVRAILDAISDLSPEDKNALAQALDRDPCPLGEAWAVLSRGVVELMLSNHRAGTKREIQLGRALVPLANEVTHRRRGPQAKKARLAERNAIIAGLVAQGMKDPQQIFTFLQEHHPDLVKKGKAFIDPEQMMDAYRRRQ